METHETQGDYCGLIIFMRLLETHRDSWNSESLMVAPWTQED